MSCYPFIAHRRSPPLESHERDISVIERPDSVDNALLMSLKHLNAASRLLVPKPHGAIMGGRENMTTVGAPSHGSNRIAVARKDPQAPASFRIPEPDITAAGKEPPLVCVPS
jgi:hypothetical protein